jgi:hypothetical protein
VSFCGVAAGCVFADGGIAEVVAGILDFGFFRFLY